MKLSKKLFTFLFLATLLLAQENIKFPIKDMDIKEFLNMVARITNTNILIDGNLQGKVDFVQTKDINDEDYFPIALSILESRNYTLVKVSDTIWKVTRNTNAASEGLEVLKNQIDGHLMQTTIFPVKSVDVASINAKIRPLLSPNAKSTFFKESNLFVVTDYPKNIVSIKKIINVVDSEESDIVKVVELKDAKAKDIYPQIDRISKTYFDPRIDTQIVNVVKDDASNSLVVVGKSKNVEKLEKVIKKLDKADQISTTATQKIFVYKLKNSSVEQMQKLLTALLVDQPPKPTDPKTQINVNVKSFIAADLENNSLVIRDTPENYEDIKRTIELLDIEKPQVYVQARIVEISNNEASRIGMKYGLEGGRAATNGLYTLGTSLTGPSVAVSNTILNKLDVSSIKEGFAIGFSLSLLKTNGAANVLSEPTILCSNNKESKIYVGKTKSILTGTTQGDNTSDIVRNTYTREDIGLTLKVKPTLTNKNKVILDIETKIEDIDESSQGAADRPTTLKREVNTSVTVRNGETIILGGLMKDAEGESVERIPGLSDVPVLGHLFTYKSKSKDQISIVIYLTPYIVPTSSDLREVRKLLAELDTLQVQYNKRVLKRLVNREYYQGNNGGKSGDKS